MNGPATGGETMGRALAPTGAGGAAPRRYTRQDVVALGRSGKAWEFLPVASAALRASPGDAEVRFLLAAALGRLGLRTLATEQLGMMEGAHASNPAVAGLREALAALPDDELGPDERRRLLAGNLEALGSRGADLAGAAHEWATRVAGEQAYRACDGNVVRRAKGQDEPWAWRHVGDLVGSAGAFVAQNISGRAAPLPPLTIEGIDPPWVFRASARAMGVDATGFQARIIVVQASAIEALDGLSIADLRGELGGERVLVFAGDAASTRYGRWLRANFDRRLTGLFVPASGTRTRCEPPVSAVVQEALGEQERQVGELRRLVVSRDRARGPAWSGGRLVEASRRLERGESLGEHALRVLIPTCRYTTFLQHAGRDLAEAFTRLGCQAEVLMEPDGHSQMSAAAYLGAIERVDPDVVVLINYTRRQLGGLMPENVPVVTWVQDMMPHLFTKESGQGQGPLDFLAGHCGEELFTRYGYDRSRSIGCPVVASEVKFHGGGVAPELRERFTCEIACVTHHSETVDAMHARLVRESAADPDAAATLEALLPVCRDVAARAHTLNIWTTLRQEVSRVMSARHRHAGNPDVEGAVLRNYAMPVADRAFRHLALEWAGAIARRRGWRLKVYGKGWAPHPTLGEFAAGLTEHGEELRAAYQCAAVNLHLCLSSLAHQRPMECALSGGLPIVRPTRDAVADLRGRAQRATARSGVQPFGVDEQLSEPLYSFADTAEGMQFASLCQRLGLGPDRPGLVLPARKLESLRRREATDPIETDPSWLFGDLGEVWFIDESSLEALVERAIERPDWRGATSAMIAGRVRERLTHVALARRIVHALARRAGELGGVP